MRNLYLFAVLSLFALTGCVTGTRGLDLSLPDYTNDESASGDIYIGEISDYRLFEQDPRDPSTPSVDGKLSDTSKETLSTLIGRQRNGFGAAMGDVALIEGSTVQSEMRELLTEALEGRGYQVVDDPNAPNKLSVDIEKFWAWFSPGFVSVSFESILQCEMDFEQPSGSSRFEVTGYGINKGQVASDANWLLAYERGFLNFLENLDKALDARGL